MKNRSGAWAFLVFSVLLLVVICIIARPFFISSVAGGMMALVLMPLYRYLNKRMGNVAAGLLATSAMALLVLVPLTALVLVAVQDANTLITSLRVDGVAEGFQIKWTGLLETISTYVPMLNPKDLQTQSIEAGKSAMNAASSLALQAAGQVPSTFLQLLMGTLSCYFFLVDGRRFLRWGHSLIPISTVIQTEISQAFETATRSTLLASFAAAGVQSLVVVITFWSLSVPAIALGAGATFVFAWIPVLGSAPVFIAAAIWFASHDLWWQVAILAGAGAFTGVIDNLVRPLVLRGGSDMHPLVSLVAILGGIEVFGIFGVILGPVLVAMFLSCARVWPFVAREAGWMDKNTDPSSLAK